jgi:predicted transcriptional regulator of viral defense system
MSVRGISGRGRDELARVLAGGRRTITPDDVVRALGVDATTAAKKLARWATDGWLRRARRGLYVPVPVDVADPKTWSEDPWILADAVWAPCYFTGWTAASHWALTEQVFRTTVVKTTARVRRSAQRLLDHDYLLAHVGEEALTWGLKPVWRSERRILVADPARVVIDALDAPGLIGGIRHGVSVLEAYVEAHPASTLVAYGDRLGNRAVFKRLGYIAEHALSDVDDLVAECARRVSAGLSTLDPSGPGGGRRETRWNLLVNVGIARSEPS